MKVVHKDEVRLLRNRGLRMLDHAETCVESKDYDLAAFLAEQSARLFLKSIVLELTEEVPRTQSIRQLLHIVGKLVDYRKAREIDDFTRRNRRRLISLEEAYITSRYPQVYERDEAEDMVNIAKEVMELVSDTGVKA